MALDESTDINDDAQLAVFSLAVNNQFEVTEELLCVKTMQGCTTTNDVFEQLCDTIEHAGLSWKSLRGIKTDGVQSMNSIKLLILDHYRKDAVF